MTLRQLLLALKMHTRYIFALGLFSKAILVR